MPFSEDLREDEKAGERRKLFTNLLKISLTGLFLFDSISQVPSFLILMVRVKRNRMGFCLVQEICTFKHPVLFIKT